MRPTLEYIKEKFDFYNRLCFGGNLPMPPIRLNLRYRQLGTTKYRCVRDGNGNIHYQDISIEISIRRDLPEEEYIDTLVHEMIHYYIAYNNIVDDAPHGTVFRQMMQHITNTYGLKISTFFNPSDKELIASVTARVRYICVVEFNDGKMGFAVVAKNKIFELWEIMPTIEGVKTVQWYASNREIFKKFPVTVSPRVILEHSCNIFRYLTGAKELYREGSVIRVKQ